MEKRFKCEVNAEIIGVIIAFKKKQVYIFNH